MKNLKKEKGITLVALIITIIILLILAVVALREITGDGIIAKAKEARSSFETQQREENRILAEYMDYLNNANSDDNGGNSGGNGENSGGNGGNSGGNGGNSSTNPWVQRGLTVPIEYDKKYTGPVAEGLGISTLTIKLGSDGKLIVEEAGLDTTYNDSKITSITSNTITYNDNGTEIRIEYNADGQSAKVFYNSAELGTLTVEQGGETIVPDTVWAQRGLTVQPVETDVTYSCEGTIAFGGTRLTDGLVIELHADGGFYISYGTGNLTEEHGTAVISGNNTITFMAGEEETFKIVISNDASEATVFGMFGTWQEGDKTLTLNTVSAE